MDFEAPVDAWYVYIAVGIVSVALAGLALGVSTGVPPDAQEGANAIEGATSAEYTASASHEHDAETVVINRRTITMENEHGDAHASFSYGTVVPVNGDERLENIVYGASIEDEYGDEIADPDAHAFEAFQNDVEAAFDDNSGQEFHSDGHIHVKKVVIDTDIDELENLQERAEVEVTETASLWGEPRENIREVELRYEGIDNRAVQFDVEGDYAGSGSFEESSTDTFYDGSGEMQIEIRSGNIDQPAAEPVEFRAEFEGGEGSTTESWERDDLSIGDEMTWSNEIERSAEFDHDHPAIGQNDGGNYYVTLVTV